MKKKFIEDKTFHTYIWFVWDCNLEELSDWLWKKFKYELTQKYNCGGKTIFIEGDTKDTIVWINGNNNIESLSHELIHVIQDWLVDYQAIPFNNETQEIFTLLHSYYFNKCLKCLNLEKFTY